MKRGSEWLRDGALVYRTDTDERQVDEILVQCADGRRTDLARGNLAESLRVLLSGRTAGRAPTPRPSQSIDTPRFKKLLDALSMLRTRSGKTQAERAIVDYIHDWADRQRQGDLLAGTADHDALDAAELHRIKRMASTLTAQAFLDLPSADKCEFFAAAVEDSVVRKQAYERMAFLHTTNKDRDGYEYGIAKVKFSPSGHIESFLWANSDNSDLDAAMAATPVTDQPKQENQQ